MIRLSHCFRSSCAVLLASWVLIGCGQPDAGSGSSDQKGAARADSVTLVLSKFYSSQNYRHWLNRLADADPHLQRPLRFVQAYGMEETALMTELGRAQAVVLTGGEDIHPGRYGQAADTVRCGRIDEERDRVEHRLLDHVIATGTPCLGVCRGLQVMNVHGGGTLRPHLPDDGFTGHRGGRPGATSDTLHPVSVSLDWHMGDVHFDRGVSAQVVSHHHQGIGRLASRFEAWAHAEDSLIEGIRCTDTTAVPFLVGVQWHPERSDTGQVLTDGLGRALLGAMKDAEHRLDSGH